MHSPTVPLHETAGQHLVARVPLARSEEHIGSVLARLPGTTFAALDAIYVLDEVGHLHGLVRLVDLLAAPRDQTIQDVMRADPPVVRPELDQEQVVNVAIRHNLTAVPVVDHAHRFLGVVPAEALLDILRREHVEDLHRLAGIRRERSRARNAIAAPPARRARDRLPWLLAGFTGSALATIVVKRFEGVLEARIAIAFFVPGIIYLADAIGTQTEAIAVRWLSLSHAPLRGALVGELATGLLIGLCLGGLSFPAVLLGFGDARLALAVALAILTAGTLATGIGLLLPWLLSQVGQDPAFGSGPVATIIQDVLSLLVYFTIVQLLVL